MASSILHRLVKNAIVKLVSVAHIDLTTYGPFVVTAVVSVGVASLSFRYFESYFLRLKHRYTGVDR